MPKKKKKKNKSLNSSCTSLLLINQNQIKGRDGDAIVGAGYAFK